MSIQNVSNRSHTRLLPLFFRYLHILKTGDCSVMSSCVLIFHCKTFSSRIVHIVLQLGACRIAVMLLFCFQRTAQSRFFSFKIQMHFGDWFIQMC